jgi:hypothetical protein
MNQIATIAITAVVGIAVGTGGTLLIQQSTGVFEPVEVEAALDVPSQAEAMAAFNAANQRSVLAVGDRPDIASLDLGQCGPDNLGPGVSCMTSVRYTAEAEPQNRLVGFAKNGSGEWVATLY